MALKYAFIWNYKGETPDQYTILPSTTILRKITKKKKKEITSARTGTWPALSSSGNFHSNFGTVRYFWFSIFNEENVSPTLRRSHGLMVEIYV